MKSLAFATIKELRDKLDKKEISAQELVTFFSDRFAKFDKKLNAAIEVFDVDSVVKDAAPAGPLAGIPGLVKDVIAQKGRGVTCGSKILKGFRSSFDATAVARLKKMGALMAGRANCDEFACGSSNESSAYGPVHNPWNLERSSGGSSGGSAVAVAAGLVPWALGTETGGSIRHPAAFCGVVGLKPTYGSVSRYGLVSYGSSLDQIGPFSRTVYDNALLFSHIAGVDPKDSSTLAEPAKDYTVSLDGTLKKGLTLGVVDNALYAQGVDSEIVSSIEQAIKEFEKLGATIKHVKLPVLDYGAATYFIISRAELASNLSKFDGVRYCDRDKDAKTLVQMYSRTRANGFGENVKRRIMIGNYVLSAGHAAAFYKNAQKVRGLIRQGFIDLYKEVDLLIMPVTPTAAFKIGELGDPLQMDLQDYFVCPMNLAGIPALSIPCGFTSNKLPIGFQIAGPHLAEELIFKTAHAYEQATQWHTMFPPDYV